MSRRETSGLPAEARSGLDPALRSQVPAQAVMTELLRHVEPGVRSWPRRLRGASPLSTQAAGWYVGALGEKRTGRALAGLPTPWAVLHAVSIGKGDTDVDHVVLGPGGVFTVNTKHHPGKRVWVAGAAADVMAPGAARRAVPGRHRRAAARRRPAGHLAPRGTPARPADLLQERFRQLQREVRSAGRTRAVWRVSVAAGALASIGVVGPDVPQAVTEAVLTAR